MFTEDQRKRLKNIEFIDEERMSELDPELIDIIIELNENGFSTIESCAGHRSGPGDMRGRIWFYKIPDYGTDASSELLFILKKYNLNDIKFYFDMDHPYVEFDAIGKPQPDKYFAMRYIRRLPPNYEVADINYLSSFKLSAKDKQEVISFIENYLLNITIMFEECKNVILGERK